MARGKASETAAPRRGDVAGDRGELSSDEILEYKQTRRFPLPLDAIYRMIPKWVTIKVVGGVENLPRQGSAVLAFKHQGFFDQYLLRLLVRKVTGRPNADIVTFAWSGDLPDRKGLRGRLQILVWKLLSLVCNGGDPTLKIRRETWREDLKDLARRQDFLLIHAPEGFPSVTMTEAKPGTGIMQYDLQVPVIPIGLWGLSPARTPRSLLMKSMLFEWLRCFPGLRRLRNPHVPAAKETAHWLVGEAILPDPPPDGGVDRRELYRRYNDRIMKAIASLVPEEIRGFYKDQVDT